jgi:hypothetical protein
MLQPTTSEELPRQRHIQASRTRGSITMYRRSTSRLVSA